MPFLTLFQQRRDRVQSASAAAFFRAEMFGRILGTVIPEIDRSFRAVSPIIPRFRWKRRV
jgi:hypothetical protein